jgi:L-asparaginase II
VSISPLPTTSPAANGSLISFGVADAVERFDVLVTRGMAVESRHRLHVAVVDSDGHLLLGARDPHLTTWWRSCAKPFQLLPFVENGGLDRTGWGDDEVALACASHGGEPEHIAIVRAMLASIGFEEGDLACGAAEPLAARGARLLRESGAPASRLHNNCSGKHAAMLAHCKAIGAPTRGYERMDHPVQQAIHRTVAEWAAMEPSAVDQAVDGCGVVVFGLPLANMALAYARLAAAARHGDSTPARIARAMTAAPFLVGGTERFDTELMELGAGNILCKVGAEGVHSVGLIDRGIGIAIKVEDGNPRAQYPAVLAVLARMGALPAVLPDSLRDLAIRNVRNTRGEKVGEIRVGRADSSDQE